MCDQLSEHLKSLSFLYSGPWQFLEALITQFVVHQGGTHSLIARTQSTV